MISLAWITPTCISFLPIFMGWYTTTENLEYKDQHPDECRSVQSKVKIFPNNCYLFFYPIVLREYVNLRFIVNKPFAIISSSLTFWLPVVVMLTLYYR